MYKYYIIERTDIYTQLERLNRMICNMGELICPVSS